MWRRERGSGGGLGLVDAVAVDAGHVALRGLGGPNVGVLQHEQVR